MRRSGSRCWLLSASLAHDTVPATGCADVSWPALTPDDAGFAHAAALGGQMRIVTISVVALLFAPCVRAEQPTEDSAARRQLADRGTRRITIGVVQLAAGAFVVPITSEPAGRKGPGS